MYPFVWHLSLLCIVFHPAYIFRAALFVFMFTHDWLSFSWHTKIFCITCCAYPVLPVWDLAWFVTSEFPRMRRYKNMPWSVGMLWAHSHYHPIRCRTKRRCVRCGINMTFSHSHYCFARKRFAWQPFTFYSVRRLNLCTLFMWSEWVTRGLCASCVVVLHSPA